MPRAPRIVAPALAMAIAFVPAVRASDGECAGGMPVGQDGRPACAASLPDDAIDQLIDAILPLLRGGERERAEDRLESALQTGKVAEILLQRLRDRTTPLTADDLLALRSSAPPTVPSPKGVEGGSTVDAGRAAAGASVVGPAEAAPAMAPSSHPGPGTAPLPAGLAPTQAAPTQAAPTPAAPTPAQAALLGRAEALLADGDVAGARLLLERLNRDGVVARASLLLGETFDPLLLGRRRLRVAPDRGQALAHYRRAAAAGSVDAAARLRALDAEP